MNGMLLSLNTCKQRHTGTLYYCNTVVSSLFLGIFMDFIKPTVKNFKSIHIFSDKSFIDSNCCHEFYFVEITDI